MLNFAQGDFVMVGSLVAASALGIHGMPWLGALLICGGSIGVLGLFTERVAVAPVLRHSSASMSWLISTLAISLILENVATQIWGGVPLPVRAPDPLSLNTKIIAGAPTSSYETALIVITVVVVAIVEISYRSRRGRAVLALAEDRGAAQLLGVNPLPLVVASFVIGGALAGITGLLASPVLSASTSLGSAIFILGFEAVAVGGVGSNWGALLAGYLVGVANAFGASVFSPGYAVAFSFAIVLIVLAIRPSGLFGVQAERIV